MKILIKCILKKSTSPKVRRRCSYLIGTIVFIYQEEKLREKKRKREREGGKERVREKEISNFFTSIQSANENVKCKLFIIFNFHSNISLVRKNITFL